MPEQSIWMIRLSLLYFLVATLLGGVLLIHKAVDVHPALWAVLPVHFEMAIWGWMIQFVMGTAYWMFPRFLKGPKRGSPQSAWWVIAGFNAGIILVLISHLFPMEWVRVSGRLLTLAGIGMFIQLMWARAVSYRQM